MKINKYLIVGTMEIQVLRNIFLSTQYPHSTECYRNMSEIFPNFHYKWNIVTNFLSNIEKYFIATLQF